VLVSGGVLAMVIRRRVATPTPPRVHTPASGDPERLARLRRELDDDE
jgi:hypothetical protein